MAYAEKKAVQTQMLPWLQSRPENGAPAWVQALRDTAAESFTQTGFPHPKQEGWQYLNLRALQKDIYSPEDANAELPSPYLEGAGRVVVVNGALRATVNLPDGVEVIDLKEAVKDESWSEYLAMPGDFALQPFKALNHAHMQDGFVLVARGDISAPVEVVFMTEGDGAASYPRALYFLEDNAGLTLVERHESRGKTFSNSVIDIVLQPDARLKHYRFQREDELASHFSHTVLRQYRASNYESFTLDIGAALARQFFNMQMLDKYVNTCVNGIYMLKDKQNHDITICADHLEPDCVSGQYFKGIVDDQARSVFQGKIHVHRPAQRTDGHQSHHALLLSEAAEARAKPELEIYADDVKCSHGATSGQLSDMALFYMRSRGISEKEARVLLIESFLSEITDRVSDERVRDVYTTQVLGWLEGRHP